MENRINQRTDLPEINIQRNIFQEGTKKIQRNIQISKAAGYTNSCAGVIERCMPRMKKN